MVSTKRTILAQDAIYNRHAQLIKNFPFLFNLHDELFSVLLGVSWVYVRNKGI